MKPFRAIFFGTPDFAVPCLRALTDVAEVVAVYSQPDRPAGRGMKLTPPPVKVLAESLGIPVFQPVKVRTRAFAEEVRSHGADVALVVAYGRILPTAILDAPRLGCVNVHGSILPRWRGAAPIQWAIVSGDAETGVSLMRMDEGMDTGPVLASLCTAITPDETTAELAVRLSDLGATLVREALPAYVRGELTAVPQPATGATMAAMLTKESGLVDFSGTAKQTHDLIRGMNPWPGAYAFSGDQRIKIHRSVVTTMAGDGAAPGTVLRADRHAIEVQCGVGVLSLLELQQDGKRKLPAHEFLSGFTLPSGTVLVGKGA